MLLVSDGGTTGGRSVLSALTQFFTILEGATLLPQESEYPAAIDHLSCPFVLSKSAKKELDERNKGIQSNPDFIKRMCSNDFYNKYKNPKE